MYSITKKIIATVLTTSVLALVAFNANAQDSAKIRIAIEGAYPPFNYIEKGQLAGFDVDIAHNLCSKMNASCEFVTQEWGGMIPGLLAGKYDAIVSSMRATEARRKQIDFTDKYYDTPSRFIAPKDTTITDVSPKGLVGKTIAVQAGTTQEVYLNDMYKDSTIKSYKTQDDANRDLASGRVDVTFSDMVMLYNFINKTQDGSCCKFVGGDIKSEKYFGNGFAVAIRKDSQELRDRFNAAIKQIVSDGSYKKINDKYFPFSIY
ncbi:transporter substrate-binding domain-containing protein [Acerihabitans arboris]|uniref:Transporter substrate-binding domain-containing protein n=1 Tax=Acerihabitans arboris TaxID=2691583 RepID=A0A845SKQ5_9GAMM|nr:transporter substrate-binding domain-containing protein [Acerihabitans arboris]NDL65863.1 transporter substrate-binding domain-containing protein [Acerihabitans arboris]